MKRSALLLASGLIGAALGWAGYDRLATASGVPEAGAPTGVEEVEMPPIVVEVPEGRRRVVLQIGLGPLPEGGRLVLETEAGRVVATVTPFGILHQDGPVQVQTAANVEGLEGTLRLRAFVETDGARRAATEEEVLGAEILPE